MIGPPTQNSRRGQSSDEGVHARLRNGAGGPNRLRFFALLFLFTLGLGVSAGPVAGEMDPESAVSPSVESPSEAEQLYRASIVSGNQRDFTKAREQLEEALRLEPDHLQADLALGVVLMVLGEKEAGQARLERIGHLSEPMASKAYSLLANQASIDGRPEDVVKHYLQGIELFPDEVAMRVNLGRSLFSQGRFEEAVPVFEAALVLKPRAKAAWVDLGRSFVRLGRTADAEVCFQRALALENRNISANWYLARIEAERGEKEKANALYEVAAESATRLRKKDMLMRIRLEQNSL